MRYEIKGYEEILTGRISPHPRNPRPTFHLADDDPHLLALSDSIKVEGQNNPAMLYEQVGHYSLPDKPGHYVLLQGERRWRACKIADVPRLRSLIVATPTNEAEEYEWLGIEEAFKLDWQPFFLLRFAADLARKNNVEVFSPEIAAKTGLSMKQLKIADAVFSLEPPIQAMVAEYEELAYEQAIKPGSKKRSKLAGSGVNTAEFPVAKAALVWEIFAELRRHCKISLVKDKSDLELQRVIAQRATRRNTSIKDLQEFLVCAREIGKGGQGRAQTKHLHAVTDLLDNPSRNLRDINRRVGTNDLTKLLIFKDRSVALRKQIESLLNVLPTLTGVDLEEYEVEALRLCNAATRLEQRIADQKKDNRERVLA